MAKSKYGDSDPLPDRGTGGLPPLPEEPPFVSGAPGTAAREPAPTPVPVTAPDKDKQPKGKKAAGTATAEADVLHTRAGSWWTALIVGALVLAMLLAFIIQNSDPTLINFLVWEWNLPLGVALLGAAILGILLAACFAGIRILQLRRAARKK